MVSSRRWTRKTIAWTIFIFASFHLIIVLLQTDSGTTTEQQQSPNENLDTRSKIVTDITIEFDGAHDGLKDNEPSEMKSSRAIPIEYREPLQNSQSEKTGNQAVQLGIEKPRISNSGRSVENKQVKTPDIPYELFLPPAGVLKLDHRKVIKRIPAKYQNIAFLKNKPSDEEMIANAAVPQRTEFGDPNQFDCDDTHCYINGRTIKREIIQENPEDMFKFLPPEHEFLKEFKNPCWKGKDTVGRENLFCFPYFFIIGFTKCGTTDLFAILKSHILISTRASKETHYFDRRRRSRGSRMHRAPNKRSAKPRSFMFYANRGTYRDSLMRTFQEVEGTDVLFHGITMDATPSNVWDNEYWELFHPGHKEPPVTNADTIAKINPKTKIIFSLRDPISRMRSAYQFFCKFRGTYNCDRPITPEKYHNLVVEAVDKFNNCLKNNTVRGCTYSTETHQLATHLYASIYHVYIMDFMKVFPRDQLYVLQMEEHISDPVTSANKLCDFLEIQRFPEDTLQTFFEQHKTRNQIKDDKKLPYVLSETTEILENFFKPYLKDLVDLLGDEKWYWNRPQ